MRIHRFTLAIAGLLPCAMQAGQPADQADAETSLWTRDRLGGDLFGVRPALAEHGVDIRLETTGFYQGLVGGDGNHDMEFSGRTDLFLALDGHKAGLWPGFFVNIHGGYRYGDLPSKGGTLAPTNGAMISPDSSGDVFALTNVVITQALSESLLVNIGKFDTIDLADRTFLGGRGVEDFMNLNFVAPPIAGRTVPASTLGAIVTVLDQGKPVFNIGVVDSRSPLTSSGFDGLSSDEITFLADYTFRTKLNGLDGTHTIGATFSTIDALSIDASDYVVPPAGGAPSPVTEGDSWQINYIFEQFLCQHADDPAKGWGFFGLLGVSDGNPNPISFSAVLGLGAKGVCAARPDDNFGVGVFYNGVSDELQDTLALANIPLDDEYGVEIYYDAAITPWFRLGADLQVANPVLERRETAVTLGIRGRLIF
jgi:porin